MADNAQGCAEIAVELCWLPHGEGLEAPAYQTLHAAGMDLQAAVNEPVVLQPLERRAIACGFVMALPPGYEAQIRARSGLALKHGIGMPNSPGTIDADYRGEVMVILINFSREPFTVSRGMRIAQMVVAPVTRTCWKLRNEPGQLSATARGSGGFGSTGR